MRGYALLLAISAMALFSVISAQTTPGDFYKLNTGDKKEYIINSNYNTSKKFEVLKDTLLSNGKTYKKISWTELSNSLADSVTYEYQRTDTSGRVYIYWLAKDTLLYDFSKNRGDIYPAPYNGCTWMVKNKYKYSAFGDSLAAVDLELRDVYSSLLRTETIIGEIGLFQFTGPTPRNYNIKGGTFWGGIIGGKKYGDLLAWDKNIDWSSFYPLQIGNMWIYKEPGTTYREVYRVLKDTVLSDGKVYKKIGTWTYNPASPGSFRLERMDSAGNIYSLQPPYGSERIYKLSSCVGDTSTSAIRILFRIWEKRLIYDELLKKETIRIDYFSINSMAAPGYLFEQGIGIKARYAEFFYEGLTGAVINGVVYGDTSGTTDVRDYTSKANNYKLFPNYPNPFNPVTNIGFSIADECFVTLKVYDMLGREAASIVNDIKPAGSYKVQFDGRGLASGIYV
ncbi:MAG: hypothetical protein ACM3Q2_12795, partial [Syntrophothermus sp.]